MPKKKKSKMNGAAPPEPQPPAEQPQATHAAVPAGLLSAMSRLLTRSAIEGQEAAELLQALQQCRPITVSPDQATDPPDQGAKSSGKAAEV